MTDLSHWDYTENFTGLEAAALILGIDPALETSAVIAPLLRRLNEAYTATLWAHQDASRMEDSESIFVEHGDKRIQHSVRSKTWDAPFRPNNLHSLRMTSYYDDFPNPGGRLADGLWDISRNRFKRWIEDDSRNGFHHQLFSSSEIVRWVEAQGINSVHRFEGSLPAQSSKSVRTTVSGRRDLLTPVIEQAQQRCRNQWDLAEVWAQLRVLAQEKCSPLIGTTEEGIQYLDVNDDAKGLSYGALRMRLARAR